VKDLFKRMSTLRAMRFALCILVLMFLPYFSVGQRGIYTSTKHGNTSTGVYRINTEPRGACSQCHYQHASSSGPSTGGPYEYALFAANANPLCYTCHNTSSALFIYQGATVYNQSSHATSSSVVWPGPTPPARPLGNWGKCVNCHNPHGYKDTTGLIPNMAFSREENLCLTCHDGSPASKNINAPISKTLQAPCQYKRKAFYFGKWVREFCIPQQSPLRV